jgi:two-component system, NarL family, captular synthesis response regulator RcsB
MFQKILIAEDLDSINLAVQHVATELNIATIDHEKYCDEALLKVRRALLENEPYDLLISDLSFKDEGKKEKLQSGEALIDAIKQIQPNLKVVVYSVEDKSYRIKSLFEKLHVDAFVLKGRESLYQLKIAIKTVAQNKTYISPEVHHVLQNKTGSQIDEFDIHLLKHLSYGITLEEIENVFKEKGIKPSSKSTIEKRLGKLKILFKANNPVHLMAIAKDLGII